ncbi:MAG: ABC transporter permease [Microlunatus sp.]
MNALETFRTAYGALRAHRMRSTLTVLGILIGIAAVMLTVALGQAARTLVLQQITAMGTNLIMVTPGSEEPQPEDENGYQSFAYAALSLGDVEALADPVNAPDVVGVAPTNENYVTATAGDRTQDVSMAGTTPDWLTVRGRTIESGRFFSAGESTRGARVAVLGTTTAKQLLGGEAVGAEITLAAQSFTVVGVLASSGSALGEDQDNLIVIPRTTMLQQIDTSSNPNDVNMLYLQAKDQESLSAAYQQIERTLMTRHGNTEGAKDFTILTQQSLIDTANQTTAILTAALGGIAAISLLVGSIGVMNIMLVSVTERVREIGLRKALGATPAAIRNQFLVEASMLGLLGGVLGLLLGMGVAWVIGVLTEFPVVPSVSATALALGVSLLIGIVAGVYPAARAARLAPIDALRNE